MSGYALLAAIICALASFAAISLLHHVRRSKTSMRRVWLVVAATATGFGIWATHFIAMLAYEPSLNIHYDILPTALSWVVAVVGVAAGFAFASWRPGLVGRLIAGVMVGLSIGGMHFIGIDCASSIDVSDTFSDKCSERFDIGLNYLIQTVPTPQQNFDRLAF